MANSEMMTYAAEDALGSVVYPQFNNPEFIGAIPEPQGLMKDIPSYIKTNMEDVQAQLHEMAVRGETIDHAIW
jgi:hypothetical protein